MSTEPGTEGSEDLRRRMEDAIAQATLSPALRKRKLTLWVVRQVLLCVLACTFWEKTWMRWVFWIGVVIAIINLAMILWMPRFLAAQRRKGTRALDRLEELERQPDDDV